MSLVTLVWSMGVASTLTFGLLYGLVWLNDRRKLENLMLCRTVMPNASSTLLLATVMPRVFRAFLYWFGVITSILTLRPIMT